MELGELVQNIVSDLSHGFPDPIPSKMSVSGGNEKVRSGVAEALHQKYGSEIVDGGQGAYSIALSYFISKYDKNLC